MGTIAGLIVGALLTYLLTSSKDLNAYRRGRLEALAFDIKELHKKMDIANRQIVDFLEKPDDLEIEKNTVDPFIEELTGRIHDINLMLNIHAKSIDNAMQDYGSDIQTWIDNFEKTELNIVADPAYIKRVNNLYNKTCDSRDVVYDLISDEIYEKSYPKRLLNWVRRKWPWN
jgi:hypothetical protein